MKKIVVFLVVFAMLFSFAACGNNNNNDADDNNEVNNNQAQNNNEVNEQNNNDEVQEDADNSEDVADDEEELELVHVYFSSDFEATGTEIVNAYDEGEVEPHFIVNDDYDDKIKVLTAGGNQDIDVFWIRTPSQAQQFISAGALKGIKDFVEASDIDVSKIESQLNGVSDADGEYYGLPISGSCWLLFYNKELFDAADEPYPTEQLTWDEYLDLAEKLTHTDDDGQKYWGGQLPPWTMNLGASSAGEYLTDEAPLEMTMKYAEVLKRMYSESHVPIEEMTGGAWDNDAYFGAGNIYMMILGDWGYRTLESHVDFEYGTAFMPVFEGLEDGSTVGQASVYSIPESSEKAASAFNFIKFLTTSDPATGIIASKGEVPSYTTDYAMEVYQESISVDGVEKRFSAKINPEQGTHPEYQEINSNYIAELQLYLLGEQTLEEAFDNFYEIREEIMSE